MTETEAEELAVRKRREEGTPVTEASFNEWWAKFTAEMDKKKEAEQSTEGDTKEEKAMEERLTGFEIFSEKAGVFSLEKLEAAAEELENDTSPMDPDEIGDVDEDLFDDDEDLDDLDFDSDDDDEEVSDDEPDI